MKNLDMSVRAYENIIIAAHALDVLIFFYDFITPRSLVIVCSKPKSKNDFNSLNSLIVNKGVELIILDDIDTYSPLYVLSDKTKYFISSIIEYKSDRIITQVRATVDSDKIARDIYDFCLKLQLKNHYIIKINKLNKKNIPRLFLDIANNFTKNNEERIQYLTNIYSYVNGLEKI
jgi:hypothetical protein